MFLANIPSPPTGVLQLGPLDIHYYALCIMLGVVIAAWMTKIRYQRRGGNPDRVWDALVIIIPAGIIGGRAYHVLTDYDKYFCSSCNPLQAFNVMGGGLGIWGAVTLGAICVWLYFRYKGESFAVFADAAAPGIVLAQAIGRLGNWFNQELYGRPTTLPWGLEIYSRVNDAGQIDMLGGTSTGQVIAVVQPTFLYELIWNVLVCVALLLIDRKYQLTHGRVFALYVAGYTAGRFVVELLRSDSATLIFGLRVNTIVSAVVFLAAIVYFVTISRRVQAAAQLKATGRAIE